MGETEAKVIPRETEAISPQRTSPEIKGEPATTGAPEPHYVRDYRRLVKNLTGAVGHEEAMRLGVGGEYEAIGTIEASLLKYLGLRDGHFLVDVGCGSGRLASALARGPAITYHGTDIIPEFLDYARAHSPQHFRFSLVDGLRIPEADDSADFVTILSVVTHLMLHETYIYLRDAVRVAKPGGLIVLSFLDPSNEWHWQTLMHTVGETEHNQLGHLNAFIEPSTIRTLARNLGLEVTGIYDTGVPFIPVHEPITITWGGMTTEKVVRLRPGELCELGQSIAILRKKTPSRDQAVHDGEAPVADPIAADPQKIVDGHE